MTATAEVCDRHPTAIAATKFVLRETMHDLLFCGHCTNLHRSALEPMCVAVLDHQTDGTWVERILKEVKDADRNQAVRDGGADPREAPALPTVLPDS